MVTKFPNFLEEKKKKSPFLEEFAKFSSTIRKSCNSFFSDFQEAAKNVSIFFKN